MHIVKQRELPVGDALRSEKVSRLQFPFPPALALSANQLPRNAVLIQADRIQHPAPAGDEIQGALQDHAHLFQILKPQRPVSPRSHDASGALCADARHPQEKLVVRPAYLHGKALQMPQRPVRLGVQQHVEVRLSLIQKLLRPKAE